MLLRIGLSILLLTLPAGEGPFGQTRVRTETIRPDAPPPVPPPAIRFQADGHVVAPGQAADVDILTDLSLLPPAVAQMRERIVAAARSGDLQRLLAVMRAGTQ